MKKYFFIGLILSLTISCKTKNSADISNGESIRQNLPPIPKSIVLFGEKVSLEDDDIIERLDREIMANTYFHSQTILNIKRAARYFPEIEQILKEQNLPNDFKYLPIIESNLANVTSPAGAKGYWQFMTETGREYKLIIDDEVDERYNMTKATLAACNYLKNAKDSVGTWMLATAAYNRGIGGLKSDMKWQEATHYFDMDMNLETSRYLLRFIAIKLIMENPEKYGFDMKKIELYKPFQTESVSVTAPIDNLALWAKEKGINYKILVKLNPWIIGNKLTKNLGSFTLLLPAKNVKLKPYAAYN
ncbi:MAG: lytic transglycosylase domain-containing protein [Bacteroidetes bacterium]|nr:lytic transglycosylase domain-containing protein [Bacteroidota bacterium]